jgi:hypothetical protein
MPIEQLYWKTIWNRAVRNQDQGIGHRMPSLGRSRRRFKAAWRSWQMPDSLPMGDSISRLDDLRSTICESLPIQYPNHEEKHHGTLEPVHKGYNFLSMMELEAM